MKDTNILLVEDNEAHIFLITRGLKKWNPIPEIHVVQDGEEAVAYLYNEGHYDDKERFPPPNLVILDLKLPKVDGIEVLKLVKKDERLRTIPVVIFSSSGYRKDIEASYRNGANGYIIKPTDPREFEEELRNLQSYATGRKTMGQSEAPHARD